MSRTRVDLTGLDGGRVALSLDQLADLKDAVGGRLKGPDAGWADAVLIWNAMVAGRPAARGPARRAPMTSPRR